MKKIHTSAKPSHYNKEVESYDAFNEANSKQLNQLIEAILKKHNVKTVLDLILEEKSMNEYEVKKEKVLEKAD